MSQQSAAEVPGDSSPPFWKGQSARALFLGCLIFLLFFRSHWAFIPALASDEGCYLNLMGSVIGVPIDQCVEKVSFRAPGAPLFWLPVGLLGKLISDVTSTEPLDWVTPLIALESFLFWVGALVALTKLLERAKKAGLKLLWGQTSTVALMILLCVPALYYSSHRTLMAHPAELFLSILTLLFLSGGAYGLSVLSAGLLILTRYNDAPIFLVIVAHYLDSRAERAPAWAVRVSYGLILAGLVTSAWFAFFHGYSGYTLFDLANGISWSSIKDFFFGFDFGAFWTAPWLLAAVILTLFQGRSISRLAAAAMIWVVSEMILCIGWGGNGGDFGHRYLIGCYAAGIILWFELLQAGAAKNWIGRTFQGLTLGNAAFLTYFMITYKTAIGTGWSNPVNGDNSDVLFRTVFASFSNLKIFKMAALQQIPLVTLYFAYFDPNGPVNQSLGVGGPGLLFLTVVVGGAIGYCVLFGLRSRDA